MGYPLALIVHVEVASACIHHPYPLPISSQPLFPAPERIRNPASPRTIQPVLSFQASPKHILSTSYSNVDSIITSIDDDGGEGEGEGEAEAEAEAEGDGDGGSESDDDDPFFCETESRSIYRIGDGNIEIEIEKIGENCRRIRSKIDVEASLQIVWDILTDYEGLADFIPGLAVSQLLEKRDNFARLFQIGQQNLAFGLKFNAKGIVDCYEKDPETLPSGQRRDIEFKMIEGDFKLFEGKWSIEQCSTGICEQSDSLVIEELYTTLSYVVDVEPKLWLPVRLIEGRVCREIQMNLSCIREKAQRAYHNTLHPC